MYRVAIQKSSSSGKYKQGEFGCVIDGGENGRVSFATFSDAEKNFLEEIGK